ncbi:MAG: 50S ribosomal protein L31 [Chloroflexi bacterium]|nr:50S ribosomal protein L31 [Chloroflexota bacterium]
MRVEVSSSSHPYFTGEQRIVDSAGQVERFRRRYAQHLDDSEDGD